MSKTPEEEHGIETLEGETCPMCNNKTLTLMEMDRDIPFFGPVAIFSMDCNSCNYHKGDVEVMNEQEPAKYTLDIDSEEDMKIRIVKSSMGQVKIPHVGSIESGENANGYVTNVEGVLNRIKKQIEFLRDSSDDKADVKKAKNLLKKLTKIMWGQEKAKLIIEDPTGNSAIISEKAVKAKIKGK